MSRKQRYVQARRAANKQGRKFSGMCTMVFLLGFAGVEIWNYASSTASLGEAGKPASASVGVGTNAGMPAFMTEHKWHSRSLLSGGDVGEAVYADILANVIAGSFAVTVAAETNFTVGDTLIIGEGELEETAVVSEFDEATGVLTFLTALKNDHSEGTPVSQLISECSAADPFTAAITECDVEKSLSSAGFVVLYIFIIYNIFLGIAILCDDYFLGALEGISEALDLSEDVAGATFMAAGSSAPELFTSLAGVAMGHAETGAGTIVGSAVFNILIIIALSAVMVPDKLLVDWRCILRDGSFYGISIVLFIIFSYDSVFELYEAIILLLMYVLYVVMMYFNQSLMAFLARCGGTSKVAPEDGERNDESKDDKSVVELPATAPPSEMGDPPDGGGPDGDITVSVVAEEPSAPKERKVPSRKTGQTRRSNPEYTSTQPLDDSAVGQRAQTMIEMKQLSQSESALKQVTSAQPYINAPTRKLTKDDLALSSKVQGALLEPAKINKIKTSKRGGSLTIGKVEYYSSSEPDLTKLDLTNGGTSKRHPHFHHKHKHNMPWSSHAVGTPPSSFKKKSEGSFGKGTHRRGSMTKHEHTRENSNLSQVGTADPNLGPDLEAVALEREGTMGSQPVKESLETDDNDGSDGEGSDDDGEFEGSCGQRCCFPCIFGDHPDLVCGKSADAERSCFGKLGLVYTWFNFVLGAPYQWLFRNTIPYARYYWSSFCMNILWIIILSLAMVAVVQKLGCILGIDAFTMGFCVIAVGTSVPDALGSMLVARDGFADMAVSNAIGSNVFDINLGLGFPYLIMILSQIKPNESGMPKIKLEACGRDGIHLVNQGMLFAKFGVILLGILVLTVVTFMASKFQLTKPLGITFVFLYIATVTYSILSAIFCDDGLTC